MNVKKFVASKTKALERTRKRRLEMPRDAKSKRTKQATGPDEHYGLMASDNPLSEQMPSEEYKSEKSKILLALKKTDLERRLLERKTILQANSPDWKLERKNRLTASWFGKVCHMRSTTPCGGIVHSMLYGTFSNKAMVHGQVNEPIARDKMKTLHGIEASICGLFVDAELPFLAASPGKILCKINHVSNISSLQIITIAV
jgi:YqaJ-like viral recombinase domain